MNHNPDAELMKPVGFTTAELEAALKEVEDLFYKISSKGGNGMNKVMPLGKTLTSTRAGRVEGDFLHFGVLIKWLKTPIDQIALDILKEQTDDFFIDGESKTWNFNVTTKEIPVVIQLIGKEYACLQNPERYFYNYPEGFKTGASWMPPEDYGLFLSPNPLSGMDEIIELKV